MIKNMMLLFFMCWCVTFIALPVYAGSVPDTGQTTCYDGAGDVITCPSPGQDFYGQDGNYTINPPSYTKLDSSGNSLADSASSWAMVRDNVTGLIWEVKTDDGGIHGKDNTYTWQDAQDVFIAALNSLSGFGGYTDWRMPTIKEVAYIVDCSTYDPAIDKSYFPYTRSSYYWSSTENAADSDYAWSRNFGHGHDAWNDKSLSNYVRAVWRYLC